MLCVSLLKRILFLLQDNHVAFASLFTLSTLTLFVFETNFLTIDALLVTGFSACRPDQIEALVQFKEEFDSRGCNHNDYVSGVWCNNVTGAVKKLHLPSGCLSGTLKANSSLFRLQHLRYLNLSNNDFTSSPLPSGFGNLNRLEVLFLSSNGFVGQVPSSFSNLSQLSLLDLSWNELTGDFSQPLGNRSKLTRLSLSDNEFSGALDPNNSLFGLHISVALVLLTTTSPPPLLHSFPDSKN